MELQVDPRSLGGLFRRFLFLQGCLLRPDAQLEGPRDEHLVFPARLRRPVGLDRCIGLEPLHDQLDLVALAGLRNLAGLTTEVEWGPVGPAGVSDTLLAAV